jgi:orotate phosphoribosyltransferase
MTLNLTQSIAKALLSINAVGFTLDAPITFKSGIISPVYVDNRQLIYHPSAWHTVIEGFKATIHQQSLEYDVIAGVAVGGVPHSSSLAYIMEKPSVFVRKEAKEHGKAKRVEGGDVADKRVLLVEDLVTTGGSSLSGVEALRESGAILTDTIAIVSYGFTEADNAYRDANLNLHTLTNFNMLLDVALSENRFSETEANTIREWFDDPHGWGEKYA